MFNPHSLIAARQLDRDPAAAIDVAWVRRRLKAAIELRERVCETPFHRLVHAEADGLPGLVIDRYDDVVVLQANTAGMDRLTPSIMEALADLLLLRSVVARNDSAARRQEGLPESVSLLMGSDARTEMSKAMSGFRSIHWADRRPAGFSTSDPTAIGSRHLPAAPACWTCSAMSVRSDCAAPRPVRVRSH
jgi:23S rRNA (cytosine1962-C5)-methyltransferase